MQNKKERAKMRAHVLGYMHFNVEPVNGTVKFVKNGRYLHLNDVENMTEIKFLKFITEV